MVFATKEAHEFEIVVTLESNLIKDLRLVLADKLVFWTLGLVNTERSCGI